MIDDKNRPFVDDDKIIDLTPSQSVDTSNQEATDNPVIIIESDDKESNVKTTDEKPSRFHNKWILSACIVAGLFILVACGYVGWRYYRHNYYVGMPVSCSPSENIEKLEKPAAKARPEVVFSHDSIGTVALNMYELRGLKAELTFTEPDSADTSVYLYSRCADFDKKGHIMGSFVVNGKRYSSDNSRLGYCAMLGDNTVIGVARNEGVRDYVEENCGSFFRQFILVSDGEIPRVFHLHKKVERCALARMSYSDQLYYITSSHPETMYDFADAIRKYGFVDAIYITGGKCHSYYRTADGTQHSIGDSVSLHPRRIPWLVFKAQK